MSPRAEGTSRSHRRSQRRCPTMIYNGFGEHRIEGIGDQHIPWVHNVRNTDMAMGIDDEASDSLIRLFNEPAGANTLPIKACQMMCSRNFRCSASRVSATC